jgi:hypothetical protein
MLPHNLFIPFDFVKRFTETHTKPEIVCLDLSVFTICDPAFRTSNEDLRTFYCCRRHKLATRAMLCNIQHFYAADSDMYCSNAQRMHCCLSIAKTVTRTQHNFTLYVIWLSFKGKWRNHKKTN